MKKVILFAGFLAVLGLNQSHAVTAAAYREQVQGNHFLKETTGEQFCWHAAAGISEFQKGYEAFKDEKWLEEGAKYYDWLISKMETAPDGYKGWIGPYMYDAKLDMDCHVGDAILMNAFLGYAEIVLKDPALKEKYGTKAQGYVDLAKKHLIEKWDKRDTWMVDGPYGHYYIQKMFIDPKKKAFVNKASLQLSIPFNKFEYMARCTLKLYRITGEEDFRDRSEKMFSLVKSRFRCEGDRYFLNYWEPYQASDMGSVPKHWVGVHPERPGYSLSEAGGVTEAFHTGIVFSEEDMQRYVNSNLWMWNKSLTKPGFKSASGLEKTKGGQDAGMLWSVFADFDANIRKLVENNLQSPSSLSEEIGFAYLKNVTMKEPPGFKRKYAKGTVKLPDIKVYPSPDFAMAVAMPYLLDTSSGETMKVLCQATPKANVKVELVSADSKTVLGTLFTGKIKDNGYPDLFRWNGKDPKGGKIKGVFRIRWTVNKSVRETPVEIK